MKEKKLNSFKREEILILEQEKLIDYFTNEIILEKLQ